MKLDIGLESQKPGFRPRWYLRWIRQILDEHRCAILSQSETAFSSAFRMTVTSASTPVQYLIPITP